MKQIYRFDFYDPPVLNEAMLQAELARQKLRRQIILWVLLGSFHCLCLIAAAILIYPVSAAYSFVCVAYACIAICGGGAVAAVYSEKRKEILCMR